VLELFDQGLFRRLILARKDRRAIDLISDLPPFGRLRYDGPNAASNAIGYVSQYSR